MTKDFIPAAQNATIASNSLRPQVPAQIQPCAILFTETKRLRIDEEYRFIEWHWLAKQKPT
jgi:hypothetical protein